MGEMEVKRENERKEMRVWSNSKFLGILCSRKGLEITIQRSSRAQKYN